MNNSKKADIIMLCYLIVASATMLGLSIFAVIENLNAVFPPEKAKAAGDLILSVPMAVLFISLLTVQIYFMKKGLLSNDNHETGTQQPQNKDLSGYIEKTLKSNNSKNLIAKIAQDTNNR